MKILLMWLVVVFSIVCGETCEATNYEQDIVISTIILEAGGEYKAGALEAIYEVIINRAKKRNLTPAEVCLQRKQFSCWNNLTIDDGINIAKNHKRWAIAKNILGKETNYTKGADHYHADYVTPYWAKSMEKTMVIGRHIFYK